MENSSESGGRAGTRGDRSTYLSRSAAIGPLTRQEKLAGLIRP
jgi:hypothetical protein